MLQYRTIPGPVQNPHILYFMYPLTLWGWHVYSHFPENWGCSPGHRVHSTEKALNKHLLKILPCLSLLYAVKWGQDTQLHFPLFVGFLLGLPVGATKGNWKAETGEGNFLLELALPFLIIPARVLSTATIGSGLHFPGYSWNQSPYILSLGASRQGPCSEGEP